jgi:hypothetical protein
MVDKNEKENFLHFSKSNWFDLIVLFENQKEPM